MAASDAETASSPNDAFAHSGDAEDGGRADDLGARARMMCDMRAAGFSLQEIGRIFGVTRERARQIIRDADGPDSDEAAEARRRRVSEERDELREQALELAGAEPGRTIEETAELLEVSEAMLRSALGDDAKRYFLTRQPSARVFSDQAILAHLREAERQAGSPLTVRAYESVRGSFGGASAPLVLQRFGTWREACEEAGVEPGRSVRRDYRRRWTEAEMIEAVAEYLEQDGARGSFADYERWARATDGIPSGQTIRTQFGTWSKAKSEAVGVLAHRAEEDEAGSQVP